MLSFVNDETSFQVQNRSFVLPLILLPIPPALIYEHSSSLLEGSIETGALIGLVLGVMLPLWAIYYFVEFGRFDFNKDAGVFRWRRRNLIQKHFGEEPLTRIIEVRNEAMENSGSAGLQYSYRLVVVLDDQTIVPLSRRYSGVHGKALDQIVDELREFLGHNP